MKKVFLDTNIIVDLIADRKPFSKYAIETFNKAEVKKIKIIGLVLNIHGPIYSDDVSKKQFQKFYENITCLEYNGFFINSTLEYSVLFEEAIRKAGFKRPIGQTSTNLTIVVDTFKFNPDNNWRRNLKKASEASYTVESKKELSLDNCLIIENLHKENAESKNLSYTLKANKIYRLCKASNIEVFFLKLENEFIAARIISIEENISYDIFACNSSKSRLNGATQFLMQYIFDYLKNQTEINSNFKKKSIFSTQLRKLILEGLFERGVIQTTDPSGITNQKVL